MTVRTVSVALKMQVSDYVANGGKAIATTKALGGELDTLAKTHKDKMNDLSRVTLGIGGALTAVAGAAVAAAYTFDKQMSAVGAAADVSGSKLNDLRKAAIQAGKDTVFSATEAAKAETELAKAGVSTSDILGGALKGSLSLAAAGQLDLGDAATYSAQAMNIFGLKGAAVGHIADVLTASANKSATDVKHMADAINQAGLVAHQTGLSLEQTSGTLALFAQNGLVGSDAGTSFKVMLQQLQAPSAKTKDLMEQLGISAYDASGNFVGITALAQNLKDKLSGLTQAQRDNAMAQIFGSDATRAASILYKEGAAGVQDWINKVNDSGVANRTAKAQMNNLAGSVEQLRGSLETLAITGSGGVTVALRHMADGATSTVNAFMGLPNWLQQTIVDASGLAGVSLLAGTGLLKVRSAVNDAKAALEGMGPAGAKASKALSGFAKWGGIAAGAGVALFGLYDVLHHIREASKPAAADIDKLTDSITAFGQSGSTSGELTKVFGDSLGKLNKMAGDYYVTQQKIDALNKGPTEAFAHIGGRYSSSAVDELKHNSEVAVQAFKDADAALTQSVNNGNTQAAAAAYHQISVQLLQAGYSVDYINKLFPEYSKAIGDSATGTSALAKGFGTANEKGALMNSTLAESVKQLGSLTAVFDSLNGSAEGWLKSQSAMLAAFDQSEAAVKKNGETVKKGTHELDLNTAAGRSNLDALTAVIDTTKDAAQARLDDTQSMSAANKVIADGREEFIKLATKILGSKVAAEKLADSLFKIPPLVAPKVNDKSIVKANDTASGYMRTLNDIDGSTIRVDYTTYFHTKGTPPSSYYHGNRWGGVYEHAADGLLRDAKVYSPAGPARYAFAEPQTGGEAFVPKRGDYGRSMSILGQAASWYGAMVVPRGAGMGGGGSIALSLGFSGGADSTLANLIQRMVRTGQIQLQATVNGQRVQVGT